MDEDWRNAFGILMCAGICDATGAGICNGVPSTCLLVCIFSKDTFSDGAAHNYKKYNYDLLIFISKL